MNGDQISFIEQELRSDKQEDHFSAGDYATWMLIKIERHFKWIKQDEVLL